MSTAIGFIGFVIISVGGFLYPATLSHLKPEYKAQVPMTIYWRSERFTATGQRMLRRAWRVQLVGVILLAVAFFIV